MLSDDDDAEGLLTGALGRYEAVGGIAGELRPLLAAPPVPESVALMFPIEPLFLWFDLSINLLFGVVSSDIS